MLLHLANTVLVWRLALKLAVPGAFAVAAVFAVHPLHVESVAWVIERKDLLCAAFYLGAVLAWMRFVEAPRPGRYCLALGLFTAGLLSKSIVVTLPAALLVWHWWKSGRLTGTDWVRLAPFFAVGLGITAGDLAFYTSREPLALGYSAVERVLIGARALWFYAGKLLWPTDLAVIYPLWEIRAGDPLGWAYVAAAAALAALLWLARHRIGRGPAAGTAFFAVTLSPVLGFVDYGYMQFSFVADRFQYLAGIGAIAVLVGAAARGADRLPVSLRLGTKGAFIVVLALLGTLTWRQSGIYRDEITFFSHIVSLNPEARDAHLNLGSALFGADRLEEGYVASLVAVEQRPEAVGAHANLGRALLLKGRFDEAETHLSRALAIDPRNRTARQNMAELRRKQGRYEEAVESLDRSVALHSHPPTATARLVLLGSASEKLGRATAAVEYYERAVEIDLRNADALDHLAISRFGEKRYEEALDLYRTMLEVQPDKAQTHSNLAATLYYLGRPEEALRSFEHALSLDPDLETARTGLERLRRALRERTPQ